MYIRFGTFRSLPDKVEEVREFFRTQVFAKLQETEGCLFASLVESTSDPNEFSSLTLWGSSDHIKAYEESGRFAAIFEAGRALMVESDDWQLQLSEDMTLEYKPVIEEPHADAYRLCAVMDEAALRQGRADNMHLRLVRLHTKDDGFEGLRQSYIETTIPALRDVKGCRNAFLMESVETRNQLISVTIWDSREDAEAYDRGPVFQSLLKGQKDLLSAHVWQTTLKSDASSKVYTNDDIQVRSYSMVTGRSFRTD